MAGFLATVVVGFAILPHDSSKWWLHGMVFSDGNRTGFTGWAGNQSLRAIITRFAGSINAGTKPWLVAALVAVVVGIWPRRCSTAPGYPMVALLTTALTGLLASPISWDHHWVWVAPGVAVAGHYAIRAWRAGEKWRARWIAAIAAASSSRTAPGRTRCGSTPATSAGSRSASCGRRRTPARSCSASTAISRSTSSTTGMASSCCGATSTSSAASPCC